MVQGTVKFCGIGKCRVGQSIELVQAITAFETRSGRTSYVPNHNFAIEMRTIGGIIIGDHDIVICELGSIRCI
jgi:hypothetical protein